jgi:hypothetical protein
VIPDLGALAARRPDRRRPDALARLPRAMTGAALSGPVEIIS